MPKTKPNTIGCRQEKQPGQLIVQSLQSFIFASQKSAMRELIIYCDESVEKGRYYSDFYGGVLTESIHLQRIMVALEQKKTDLHLHDEVKWGKVTANYLEKYKALMELFFEFVHAGELKVRIMFRQNAIEPTNLTHYNKEHGYFLLYYQFLKHAFGLRYCNPGGSPPVFLRVFF